MAGETMNRAECGLKEQKQKRYVDINPAIEFLEGYDNSWGREFADGVRTALHSIKKLPVADVREVKHGEWIIEQLENEKTVCYCSRCGAGLQNRETHNYIDISGANYCPYCGAKMDEEDGK